VRQAGEQRGHLDEDPRVPEGPDRPLIPGNPRGAATGFARLAATPE
jgi:hypothetical protein